VSSGETRKLRAGHGVAVDAARDELVVQVNGPKGNQLVALPRSGGPERPIPLLGPLRLAATPVAPGAVGPDGRIAVTVASTDSWFWGVGLLDPVSGSISAVPVGFEGDVQFPSFGRDGTLRAVGVGTRSALWRFRARGGPDAN